MNVPPDHTYKLRYRFESEPGAFTVEDLKKTPGLDGSDAIILFKLVFPRDGTRQQMFYALDGRSKQTLEDQEIWKTWAMLSVYLTKSPTLGDGEKAVCQHITKLLARASRAPDKPKKKEKQNGKRKTK